MVPIEISGIAFKEDEDAYLNEKDCVLYETRAVRHHIGGGIGLRIMKGVYVGGTRGASESRDEWRTIDQGHCVLTNKRIIFDGSKENRVIALAKVISASPWADSIEVSIENRKKSMLLKVSNPYLWSAVIQILSQVRNPKQIDKLSLEIK